MCCHLTIEKRIKFLYGQNQLGAGIETVSIDHFHFLSDSIFNSSTIQCEIGFFLSERVYVYTNTNLNQYKVPDNITNKMIKWESIKCIRGRYKHIEVIRKAVACFIQSCRSPNLSVTYYKSIHNNANDNGCNDDLTMNN